MTQERKNPHLSGIASDPGQERIPTLSEVVAPDIFDSDLPAPGREPGSTTAPGDGNDNADDFSSPLDNGSDRLRLDDYDFIEELANENPPAPHTAPSPEPGAPIISVEEIESLSDRVLDRIAPALREAVTAALTELLDRQDRGRN